MSKKNPLNNMNRDITQLQQTLKQEHSVEIDLSSLKQVIEFYTEFLVIIQKHHNDDV